MNIGKQLLEFHPKVCAVLCAGHQLINNFAKTLVGVCVIMIVLFGNIKPLLR